MHRRWAASASEHVEAPVAGSRGTPTGLSCKALEAGAHWTGLVRPRAVCTALAAQSTMPRKRPDRSCEARQSRNSPQRSADYGERPPHQHDVQENGLHRVVPHEARKALVVHQAGVDCKEHHQAARQACQSASGCDSQRHAQCAEPGSPGERKGEVQPDERVQGRQQPAEEGELRTPLPVG